MKKTYAIIGNPISHSLSPVLHNYWFKKYKIEANYYSIEAEETDLKKIIKKIRNREILGLNVTLPYKQKIISYIDELINDAKITNSVNTIYLTENNTVVGDNTDVFGLQAAYLKEITNTHQKKALVIGAGGVSPSIIYSLQKSKITNVTLSNRTYEKSIFLKKKFNFINILKWEDLSNNLEQFDIIINATSLGLKSGNDFDIDFSTVGTKTTFIDTIYNPLETKTLKILKQSKIKTFNGLDMFIYQGQKSFYIWNKINPEINEELIDLLISKLK